MTHGILAGVAISLAICGAVIGAFDAGSVGAWMLGAAGLFGIGAVYFNNEKGI